MGRWTSVSPYFLSALAASCLLYSRTEYNQGFICFMMKNKSFSSNTRPYFQSKRSLRTVKTHQHPLTEKECGNVSSGGREILHGNSGMVTQILQGS